MHAGSLADRDRLQVGAGAEGPAGSGQDADEQGVVGLESFDGGPEPAGPSAPAPT
jgi:hypothetical protein